MAIRRTSEWRLSTSITTSPAALLRTGRTVMYGTADVSDADGRRVAHHPLTYLRPKTGASG